ncbi:MAG: cytochrome c [Rhodospirillales bacterium]|nr:cytochrome c [Rhodospirillales bacterium]
MAQTQMAPGNLQRGQDVATRACTSCHVIGRAGPGDTARVDVPSFSAIANRPGVTAEQLAGRIIVPHPAMPNVSLTVQEIRDVVAYILSLKRKD